ncbi:hypothetical protein GCM10009854_39750 [Saccharopolyspora halophila]|uniref:Uncharacterized protein n=1 Tax=Saccharopolyspora halophila TaxID=405551 RepID=A0ABN3GPX3_9PSEU
MLVHLRQRPDASSGIRDVRPPRPPPPRGGGTGFREVAGTPVATTPASGLGPRRSPDPLPPLVPRLAGQVCGESTPFRTEASGQAGPSHPPGKKAPALEELSRMDTKGRRHTVNCDSHPKRSTRSQARPDIHTVPAKRVAVNFARQPLNIAFNTVQNITPKIGPHTQTQLLESADPASNRRIFTEREGARRPKYRGNAFRRTPDTRAGTRQPNRITNIRFEKVTT